MIIIFAGIIVGLLAALLATGVFETVCVAASAEASTLATELTGFVLRVSGHPGAGGSYVHTGVTLLAAVVGSGVLAGVLAGLVRASQGVRRVAVAGVLIAALGGFLFLPASQAWTLVGVGIVLTILVSIAGKVLEFGITAGASAIAAATVALSITGNRTHAHDLAVWLAGHAGPQPVWGLLAAGLGVLPVIAALGVALRR